MNGLFWIWEVVPVRNSPMKRLIHHLTQRRLAFNSMLRILHRGSPFAFSSFKANYFHKISSEAGDGHGPSSQRGFDSSSSPTKRRGRQQRSHGTSSDTD